MDHEHVITKTADYIKERLSGETSGHDWWHIFRVWNMGKKLAAAEGADTYVVELTCLLHDIADYKLHGGDEEIGPRLARGWLEKLSVENQVIDHVTKIIATSSFKGAATKNKIDTLEGQCVQDADRLDAIGAVGIARCFAFGGARGNVIHDPSIPINMHMSEEEYKRADHTQINHFYEKLLLLKDLMNTKTAKKIAQGRHDFTKLFVEEFHQEWEGNK